MNPKNDVYVYYSNNKISECMEVLKNHPELVYEPIIFEETILFDAIAHKNHEWIKELLTLDIDLMKGDKMKQFPLAEALRRSDYTTIKLLVEAGADVNKVNEEGDEGLSFSIIHDDIQISEFLIQNGGRIKKYEFVIDNIGSSEMVTLLERHEHVFCQEGASYWEEQRLALLMKEPRNSVVSA